MSKFSKVLILLWAQALHAQATTLTPQNFAFTATLSEGKQSLRRFELPYQILAGLEREDYGDLRIFNNQNQSVPFSISQLEPQTQQNNDVYDLRFFRLADSSSAQPPRSGLEIEFSQNSTRFSFKNSEANNEQPNYLLIENQHPNDELHALKLNWQQPNDAFSIKVKLESSDDLQSWQSLNDSITLYDLKYLDTTLIQNTVPVPFGSHAKYLRLSFLPSSNFSLQIEKITGEYQHSTSVERENWQSFTLEPGEHPNEWLFNTRSFAPITKIAFKIPATGLFYQGSLYSKNDNSAQNTPRLNRHSSFKREVKRALHRYPEYEAPQQDFWRYQAEVRQYRLLTAAGEIESEPVSVYRTKDWEWKLVLEQPATLLPEQIPSVKAAWHPVMVTFLAQGNPPYKLFFGNGFVAPMNAALPPTLDYNAVETVEVLSIQKVEKMPVQAEPEKLLAIATQLDWRKILLWLLLSAGVLVMGIMAYQLYKRMNQKQD